MFVQIANVLPMQSHEYTDRQGQTQVFRSKGFLLQTEDGQVYAEAVQDTAISLEEKTIEVGMCAFARLSFSARTYKTSQGEERVSNEVTIQKLTLI